MELIWHEFSKEKPTKIGKYLCCIQQDTIQNIVAGWWDGECFMPDFMHLMSTDITHWTEIQLPKPLEGWNEWNEKRVEELYERS